MAEKNIIRKERNRDNPYAQIFKSLLNDRNLSFKARGIAAYILSKPDDWVVIISDLMNNSTDGETSVRSGLKELIDNRYLQRYPVYINAKVGLWESILNEEPYSEDLMIKSIKYRLVDSSTVSRTIVYKNGGEKYEELLLENLKVAKYVDTSIVELLLENLNVGEQDVENVGLLINNNTYIDNTDKRDVVEGAEASTKAGGNNTTKNELVSLFESNICELKPIIEKKFKVYCNQYSKAYIETIIEICAESNIKSYAGFKTIIDGYINLGLDTPEKVLNYIEDYRNKSKKIREQERKKREKNSKNLSKPNKNSTFNNFEQREYDFDNLEKKLLGWEEPEDDN